jgi:flagellar biosynthetic protein FliQ
MEPGDAVDLVRHALVLALTISAPMLLCGLIVGIIVSLIQAVTQIQEQTLTFIPKVVAMAVVIVIAGPWMLGQIVTYTQNLYQSIPSLVG